MCIVEQPWRQDFCHTWWWYQAGWWTKPEHIPQNWLFQHYRVCSLLCRLTLVFCCLTCDFFWIALGLIFLSGLNISSDFLLCSQKKVSTPKWLGKGFFTDGVQPGVGLFLFPYFLASSSTAQMRAGLGSYSGLICQTVFSLPKLSMLVACLREVVAPGS